jgi:hypothetical protein
MMDVKILKEKNAIPMLGNIIMWLSRKYNA